ncbi:hypothetical protein EGJ03_03055 [Stenotrophomonas maltophilia]|nr:hypothetical protein EGJ06_16745 [Stenotrophomonas maltophilia]RRU08858.1 hypothetical protein EGJ77_16300 [Stenotrophomonas maltophilia]RRU35392.1 hypothetical protein EGJ03_03055 [Stenotrophomonas maltophilia]RRU89185.1 hypothetical protein EGI98_01645 [Stenotrophomonas maltophilia]RRU96911.1 hypothetical protein EGI91_07785 [Stenotrophomonas maltophilia]
MDRIRRVTCRVAYAFQPYCHVEKIDFDRIAGKGIWMNVNATHPVDDAALVLPAQLWSRIPPTSRYLDEPGTGLRN